RAEPVAEDVEGAAGGEQPAAGQAQQRRLAGPVGAEDDPALARTHRPVDPVEDGLRCRRAVEEKRHAPEGEHRGVTIRFLFHRGRRLAARPGVSALVWRQPSSAPAAPAWYSSVRLFRRSKTYHMARSRLSSASAPSFW